MNYRELFIMGIPNVGKTTLIERLGKDNRFYIPKHSTSRPKRIGDNNFYEHMPVEYFINTDMYIVANDNYGRYYGVANHNIENQKSRVTVYNCSIKNINQLLARIKNGENILLCILLSRTLKID